MTINNNVSLYSLNALWNENCSNVVKVKFIINDIKNIVWNLSCFDNLTISIVKKKVITVFIRAYMLCIFSNVMNKFVVRKKQELITLLQYEIQCLIFFYKLTSTFNDSSKVNKILITKELSKYFKKLLYTVSSAFLYLSNHSDFADICWWIKSELKDT